MQFSLLAVATFIALATAVPSGPSLALLEPRCIGSGVAISAAAAVVSVLRITAVDV
ncbi:hypothetical protein GQ53DRAFT_815273 [Thozetella sp. PMI_491]|nr:hypothetical protein GQ53DRAFT_815273 [Thozetella sp. PMI_491]